MKTLLKWIIASLSVVLVIYGLACICLTPSFDGGFLEHEKCPACYGQSLCSSLTTPDNEIALTNDRWNILSLVNVRNVFFGSIHSRRVVFKKLGHDWELHKFDLDICNAYGQISERDMSMPCDSSLALQNILRHYGGSVFEVINNHPDVFESCDTLKCISGHRLAVNFLLRKFSEHERSHEVKENFLTVMAINPEPIILMVSKTHFMETVSQWGTHSLGVKSFWTYSVSLLFSSARIDEHNGIHLVLYVQYQSMPGAYYIFSICHHTTLLSYKILLYFDVFSPWIPLSNISFCPVVIPVTRHLRFIVKDLSPPASPCPRPLRRRSVRASRRCRRCSVLAAAWWPSSTSARLWHTTLTGRARLWVEEWLWVEWWFSADGWLWVRWCFLKDIYLSTTLNIKYCVKNMQIFLKT